MKNTNKKDNKEKEKTGLEKMWMKDRKGMPLNPALQGKSSKKYGALQQH